MSWQNELTDHPISSFSTTAGLGEEDEAVKQKDEPKQPVIPLPEIKSPYVIKSVSYLDVRDPFGLSDPEAGESEHFQSEYSWVACGKDKYAIYNTIKRGSECQVSTFGPGRFLCH